jgi:Fe-S-cluster containining protein
MRAFYARVDAAVAERGLRCRGCGECCHFDTADHVLYASGLERRFLADAPLPAAPDADAALIEAGARCPFQSGSSCHARGARALGCRLHFCEWDDSEREMDFSERWHAELKALHDALGEAWDYRPLLPLE